LRFGASVSSRWDVEGWRRSRPRTKKEEKKEKKKGGKKKRKKKKGRQRHRDLM